MRYLDPHVHGEASACSLIRDSTLLEFFDEHPDYLVTVTDHGSVDFYRRNADRLSALGDGRILYGMELSLGYENDFVLLSYDLEPLVKGSAKRRSGWNWRNRPFDPTGYEVLYDDRVLVTWAHPHQGGMPSWIGEVPVNFVELNSMRLTWRSAGRWVWQFYVDIAHGEAPYEIGKPGKGGTELFPRWIVGSDAHETDVLGHTRVEFLDEVASPREAWEALREGRYRNRLSLHDGGWDAREFGASLTEHPWMGVRGWA